MSDDTEFRTIAISFLLALMIVCYGFYRYDQYKQNHAPVCIVSHEEERTEQKLIGLMGAMPVYKDKQVVVEVCDEWATPTPKVEE